MNETIQQAQPQPARSTAALAVVYLTVFLDLLGFGIILPALPFYAQQLGADGLRLGLLFTAYSLAQLAGASVLGRLSDRHGRRPILMASLAGSAVAMTVAGFATQLWVLLAARLFAGAFGGSISAAQAYVADVTTKEERAKYMGFLGASIGLGFVLGPAFGAGIAFAGGGFAGAAFTAAGLAAANLLFAWRKLPETHPPGSGETQRATLATWAKALASPNLAPNLLAVFLTTFAFVSLETTFAYFGQARFGLDDRGFGLTLVGIGMVGVFAQAGLVGRLSRRLGVRPVAAMGTSLLGLALLALPFCPGRAVGYAVLLVLAVGQGLASPTLSTLLSQAADAAEQGLVLGSGQSFSALARATGPLVAGALYDRALPAPYLLAGVAGLAAAGLVLARRRPSAGSM